MWPFRKKDPPPDVLCGGMVAHYDQQIEYWAFECDGIEFHIKGIPFKEEAFDWARQSVEVIRTLDQDIRAGVSECLQDWPCDESKAEILAVELDEYPDSKTILVAFTGDDSWGDFGVDVTITDGRIVDVSGGD